MTIQRATAERVLVVDDEPVMRDVLCRFLRRAEFDVTEVGSVVGALDELMATAERNEPYQHTVVDLILKDGDGEDVVRACESLTPRPNIIVLSGNIDSRRALDLAGRCLYLPKPVAAKTLLEALRRRRDPVGAFVDANGLTRLERDALMVAANGVFKDEAAQALGVTREGLRKRWRRICEKTSCSTPQQVLAKIIRESSDDFPMRAVPRQRPVAAVASRPTPRAARRAPV